MINEKELREKALKSVHDNFSLEKQFDFFAPVIVEFAPIMPDVWHGGGRTGGTDFKNIRLCWQNEQNDRCIELTLYDSFAGSLFVNGNQTSIKALATEKEAREAFESAFRFVFGEMV